MSAKSKVKQRAPKNYFMVNLSKRDRVELETLCRANRTNLKTETRNAITGIKATLQARTGLGFNGVWLDLASGDWRALKYFSRDFDPEHRDDLASIAQFIFRTALCRPAQLMSWMDAVSNYCGAEEINQFKFLADSVAARREYRRVKVGAK